MLRIKYVIEINYGIIEAITMKYYNHIYKVFLIQIQLARNHGPLKPCALNHLHPYSFKANPNM